MVDYTPTWNLPYPAAGDTVRPESRDFANLALGTAAALSELVTQFPEPPALTPEETLTSADNLDSTPVGTLNYVYAGSPPANSPGGGISGIVWTAADPDTGFVRLQVFYEAAGSNGIWTRYRSGNPSTWGGWVQVSRDKKTLPVYLTRPMGPANTDSATSRAIRIPFRVPTRATRWRLVFRNVNHRGNQTSFPGNVRLRELVVGDAALDENGQPTGSYDLTGTQAFPQGMRYLLRDLHLGNLANQWVSPWVTGPLEPGREYLMSYGYQTDGQPNHLAMAGSWWHSDPVNGARLPALPTGATRSNRAVFDVRLEIDAPAETPTQIIIGDSIQAGSNAEFAVRDAPANLATASAGGSQPLPVMHAFGGGYIIEWYSGVFGDLTQNKWIDAMRYGKHDRVVLAMGSNDIHDGTSLAVMKLRYTSLIKLVRERLSPNVVAATITPRTAWATTQPEKEAVRQGFNDWLATLPEGVVACIDVATPVTAAGATLLPGTDAGDGIHFTTLGSALMGQALAAMSGAAVGASAALDAYLNTLN